jgi:ubiquinone/menaquinone biosynthesis C-methylase UbiE
LPDFLTTSNFVALPHWPCRPFAEVAVPTYYDVIKRVIPEVEYHQNRYARGLADVVRPGCRWLDVGAGTKVHDGWIGLTAEDLATRAELLVGCDMVETHLLQNQLLANATVADAIHLPFCDDSFDLVTANMVLEHLEDPYSVFSEVARVLAPGGHFVFVTPNVRNPLVWAASLVLSKRVRKRLAHLLERRDNEHIFHTFYRANSRPVIEHLCERVPLRVEQIDPFNSYPNIRFWPLTAVEALVIKAISRGPLKRFTSNLFGVLEKTAPNT